MAQRLAYAEAVTALQRLQDLLAAVPADQPLTEKALWNVMSPGDIDAYVEAARRHSLMPVDIGHLANAAGAAFLRALASSSTPVDERRALEVVVALETWGSPLTPPFRNLAANPLTRESLLEALGVAKEVAALEASMQATAWEEQGFDPVVLPVAWLRGPNAYTETAQWLTATAEVFSLDRPVSPEIVARHADVDIPAILDRGRAHLPSSTWKELMSAVVAGLHRAYASETPTDLTDVRLAVSVLQGNDAYNAGLTRPLAEVFLTAGPVPTRAQVAEVCTAVGEVLRQHGEGMEENLAAASPGRLGRSRRATRGSGWAGAAGDGRYLPLGDAGRYPGDASVARRLAGRRPPATPPPSPPATPG